MEYNLNTPLVQLGNSSKEQLKKEADQWVAQAKKDAKRSRIVGGASAVASLGSATGIFDWIMSLF